METFFHDVIIIGCGAAGLRAGIAVAQEGQSVCILSKASHGLGTCTIMSRGHFAGRDGLRRNTVNPRSEAEGT